MNQLSNAVELLGDFPFTGDAERPHAVGFLLLPFLRELVDGPTPIHHSVVAHIRRGSRFQCYPATRTLLGRVVFVSSYLSSAHGGVYCRQNDTTRLMRYRLTWALVWSL